MPIDATGFEAPLAQYTSSGWTAAGVSFSTSDPHEDSYGNGGVQCLLCTTTGSRLRTPPYPSATTEKWLGVAYRQVSAGAGYAGIIEFANSAGVVQLVLRLRATDGAIELRLNTTGGTLLATVPSPFNLGTWYWLDIQVLVANSGGYLRLYRVGEAIPLLEFVGDTQFATPDGFSYVALGGDSGGGGTRAAFDDLVIRSSAEGRSPYEALIPMLPPDSAGSHTGLVSSSANPNWQNVSVTPPTDLVWNEGTADGEYDLYGLGALPWTPEFDPQAVVVRARLSRDGTITAAQTVIQSNGVDDQGTPTALGAAGQWVGISTCYSEDPDGSAPWTAARVNAMQAGAAILTSS